MVVFGTAEVVNSVGAGLVLDSFGREEMEVVSEDAVSELNADEPEVEGVVGVTVGVLVDLILVDKGLAEVASSLEVISVDGD